MYEMSYAPLETSYRHRPLTQEQKALVFLGSTMVTPFGWWVFGATRGASALWKIRQALLAASVISSGGGGPGESPTSTDSPPVLHQQGPLTLDKQGQPVPVVVPAASNSAHGGGRSGAKPRYCPRGYYWDRARKKCMPLEGPNDYRRFKRRYRRKG